MSFRESDDWHELRSTMTAECATVWPSLAVEYLDEIESTHTYARAKLVEGRLQVPSLVVANYQTAGRGRRGTRWESGAGESLLFNLIVVDPGHEISPTLLTAVSLAQGIRDFIRVQPSIKWPNDVHLDGQKVSGIIGELSGRCVNLGIGVNVLQTRDTLPAVLDGVEPTSLRLHSDRPLTRAAVLVSILRHLKENLAHADAVLAFLQRHLSTLGRRIEVDCENERIRGVAMSLTPTGALQVQLDDGTVQTVVAGRIRHLS